jgi:hypothetical protein
MGILCDWQIFEQRIVRITRTVHSCPVCSVFVYATLILPEFDSQKTYEYGADFLGIPAKTTRQVNRFINFLTNDDISKIFAYVFLAFYQFPLGIFWNITLALSVLYTVHTLRQI